ncbi:hypothetical protein RclHR1_03690004 [Rhizophagus clarus]|uniref:Uncharacterized protein n=1 Tax=Rhizophagus clarus TaxID=94130 RepID=A0A2Z6RTP6_9GLOM|nr:hypothetical protein RclHR1_03690004 [Rhizophagus clarus]GES77905.1 hypothetical protein GLOIN_2v1788266 [Rhizophagus clarus]
MDWYAKLNGLPSILMDKIWSSLYKKYKKETGREPWQLSEVHESEVINSKPENKVSYLSFSGQCEEKGPITFEVKPDQELIIKSVLEHFPYLKFRNSFKGIDNYNLNHLSRGAHHLFVMENMGIMDYMANGVGMEQNIFLLASLQAINSKNPVM